jgi:hypothetical protein
VLTALRRQFGDIQTLPEFHADGVSEESGEQILHFGSREIEVDFNGREL